MFYAYLLSVKLGHDQFLDLLFELYSQKMQTSMSHSAGKAKRKQISGSR